MGTHSIAIPEELQETETSFQHCGSITKRALNRLPSAHAFIGQGHGPGPRDPFTRGLAVSPIISQSEVDHGDHDVPGLMEVELHVDDLFVQNEMPPSPLDRRPQ